MASERSQRNNPGSGDGAALAGRHQMRCEVGNRRIFAAQRTARVGLDAHIAEGGAERIVNDQRAGEAISDAEAKADLPSDALILLGLS